VQHVIFLIAALMFSKFVILPNNLEMEQKQAKEKIIQISNIFKTELEYLSITNHDWSVWDDTYYYVQNRNKEFIHSNFTQAVLKDIKLNHMEIFDLSGNSIYAKDDGKIDARALLQYSQTLKSELLRWKNEDVKAGKHGIVVFENTIAFVSINPILRGEKKGSPIGMFMMIRIIDDKMLENINKNTNSTITIIKPDDFSSNNTMQKNDFFTEIIDDENMIAYGYLKGLDEKVSVVFKSNHRRDFMIDNKKSITYFFLLATALGVISLIISLYSMQISIIRPIKNLIQYIANIRDDKDYINAPLEHRKDEIGVIAQEFNLLLEKLNKTNEVLLTSARIDTLTGLANRLDIKERFEQEKNVAIREGVPLNILMLDIDYFKNYNDTYGHVKGDAALALVAQAIKGSSIRSVDYFARYGGEEFLAILPRASEEGTALIAQRILENIENLNIEHTSSLLEKKILSVSIGCLSVVAKNEDTQEYLINMADEALYKAKQNGRNRYYVYN
jgi:diguanylate cyclase (GGDEF)-like protein